MKIARFIVIGALLGTMTQTEVAQAVQLQAYSDLKAQLVTHQ